MYQGLYILKYMYREEDVSSFKSWFNNNLGKKSYKIQVFKIVKSRFGAVRIYAVKGNLGNGEELPTGTVLDLEAMQDAGEEFSYLPVSDEEMNSVVNGIYQELPVNSDIEDDSF